MDTSTNDDRRVIKARKNREPGRVVRVPLGDGRCGYGRQLTGSNVEFYDRVGQTGESIDLLELVTSPVVFTVWVENRAFSRRRDGPWEVLDVVTLTPTEKQRVYLYTKQEGKKITIYRDNPAKEALGERPYSSYDDARDLELAAGWSHSNIEERLRDHFAGRRHRLQPPQVSKP